MINATVTYLLANYPQIAGYATLVLVIVFITVKVCKFYFKTQKTNDDFPGIKFTLGKIDKGLATLNQILLEKTVISQSCYSNENSPRVISDLGRQLYQESGAEKLFENIQLELIAELESNKFESLLELERNALQVLIAKMNDSRFKSIQNFAFEHPTFKEMPLTYTDILFLMGLKLRDAYREKYPESKLGEEDNTKS